MPPKIKELEKLLLKAGFIRREGKGSHRVYEHPSGHSVTVAGQPGADAKRYQEKDVRIALEIVKNH